jgi:uncharacterized membrane protein
MSRLRSRAPLLPAVAFALSGAVHLVRPQVFEPIMPRVIPQPQHRPLIYLSGLIELVCAAGLARRHRWAGPASAALLVAVFPANVQTALDAGTGRNSGIVDNKLACWLRLPLQLPMIWAALQVGRDG